MQLMKKRTDINDLITERHTAKHKITYDILHADRKHMFASWKFSRTEGHPFNMHLSFSFKTDTAEPENDIKMVRAVSHSLRMWFQHKKIPSHLLSTRFVAAGSETEEVDLLVHVPEQHVANFNKNVEKWPFGIKIEPVTYEADHVYDDGPCNILQLMLKATSNETRSKDPHAPHQASAPMKGRRCFSSMKLGIPAQIRHRAENTKNTTDNMFAVLKQRHLLLQVIGQFN